jgi:hypothetical protein
MFYSRFPSKKASAWGFSHAETHVMILAIMATCSGPVRYGPMS